MHKPLTKLCLCAALALSASAVFALEFRSAAKHGVVLYDTPSEKARKVYILSRGTPVEILAEQNDWLRVRDQGGSLAWVPRQDVTNLHTLQITRPAVIYRETDNKSAPVFRAEPGLLLEMVENTKKGWLKVKHRDGQTGYIRIEDVWGL